LRNLIAISFILLTLTANAANWYVRYPNGGTGTSWANAAPGFWALTSVAPGDTIWLAGGTEFQGTIAWSGTAGNPISIKRARATESACTSSPGWNVAYDAQVVINVPYVQGSPQPGYQCWQNYVRIDGMVADGIKFVFSTPTNDWANQTSTKQMGIWGGGSHCSVSNVEFQGSVTPNNQEGVDWGDFNRFGQLDDLTLSHLNIHGCSNGFQIGDIDHLTVEYCEISVLNGNTANHDNGSYTFGNLGWGIWRYNYMHDFSSFGFALIASLIGQAKPHDWQIYGNVWQNTARPGSGQALVFDNACSDVPCQLPATFEVYNNTFVNCAIGVRAESRWPVQFPGSSVAGGQFKNNIVYSAPYLGGLLTHDYNWVNQSTMYGYGVEAHGVINGFDPFVNLSGNDFHIRSSSTARDRGVALAGEFATDRDGSTRGSDGLWDIGAYEFVGSNGGAGSFAFSVSSQTVVQNTGQAIITVNRNGGASGAVTVTATTANGTASAGTHYTATTQVLSWSDGQIGARSFAVPISTVPTSTSDLTFTVGLSSATGGASISTPSTQTITIQMNRPTAYLFSIGSLLPNSGVAITVSPSDINGQANGTTAFTRSFYSGTSVTLTAPSTAGGNSFLKWLKDGADLSGSQSVVTTADAAHTYTAVYGPPPPNVFTLTINSIPTGKAITVSPSDTTGATNGTAPFTRSYTDGTVVSLTAPSSGFAKWQKNGTDHALTAATTVTVDASYTMTAIYNVANAGTIALSAPSYQTHETNGTVVITANRTGGTNTTTAVSYATASGSAVAGTDFTSVSGTLSWGANENGAKTFSVPIINSGTFATKPRSFTVMIANPTNGAQLGLSQATVSISMLIPIGVGTAVRIGGHTVYGGNVSFGSH